MVAVVAVTVTVRVASVTVFMAKDQHPSCDGDLLWPRCMTYLGLALLPRGLLSPNDANPQEGKCDSNKSGGLHGELPSSNEWVKTDKRNLVGTWLTDINHGDICSSFILCGWASDTRHVRVVHG